MQEQRKGPCLSPLPPCARHNDDGIPVGGSITFFRGALGGGDEIHEHSGWLLSISKGTLNSVP